MKSQHHSHRACAWIFCIFFLLVHTKILAEKNPAQLPSNDIITKYQLLNPSQFPQALAKARELEVTAATLRKDGEVQMRTPDLRSSLSGRHSSAEDVRQRGRKNIAQAEENETEAKQIKASVEEVTKFYLAEASKIHAPRPIKIAGTNGNSIEATVIGLYANHIIVRRQGSGDLMGLGFQHLHPSGVENVATETRRVMLERMASNLSAAYSIEPRDGRGKLEMVAVLPVGNLLRDSAGTTRVIEHITGDPDLDGKVMDRKQREIEEFNQQIAALEERKGATAPDLRAKLREIYAQSGNPQSFVVERILSFEKFPLQEYGEYIYQVSIGGNPTILVTRQTQYVTAGHGSLLLKPAGNHDVTMQDGSSRTVPALVEIDQSIIDEADRLVKMIEEAEADSQKAIDEMTTNRDRIKQELNVLQENKILVEKVDDDIRSARALAGR